MDDLITMSKQTKGFTLIELLVVISIIGLLSSVVLASLNGARLKASDARRVSNLQEIAKALELYYNASTPNSYPVMACDSRTLMNGTVEPPSACWNTLAASLATYIKLPVDSRNGSGEGIMCGNCGEYYYTSNGQSFFVSTYLAVNGSQKLGIQYSDGAVMGSNAVIDPNRVLYAPFFSVSDGCSMTSFYSCI